MRYNKGFTLTETIIYIFAVTIILTQTVNLSINMYKWYLNSRYLTIRYNDIQNFYLSLDDIKNKKENEKIEIKDNKITFYKADNERKQIKVNNSNKLVVDSFIGDKFQSTNVIIDDIKNLTVKKKGKIIYIKVCDNNERNFIACI